MRKMFRNIEFHVNKLDDNRCEWVVYSKNGLRFVGVVEGDEGKATAEAKAEIDAFDLGYQQGQSRSQR